jgi:NADH-quinone oxidoreductase subunit N
MFALTGFPPFAGFIGKYKVFGAAVSADLTWLAILGVLTSIISAFYYLRVLVAIWMRTPEDAPEVVRQFAFPVPLAAFAVIVICAVALLALGVLPGGVLTITNQFFDGVTAVALGR